MWSTFKMGNEVCRIAFSKEHWFSPFKINQNEKQAFLQKKRLFRFLWLLFSPLFAPFSFYLLTAYFKARKIHDLNPAEKVDLNDDVIEDGVIVKSKCSSTNETIFIHKGFGDFRLNEILQPIQCPCCRQVEKSMNSSWNTASIPVKYWKTLQSRLKNPKSSQSLSKASSR